MQIKLRALGNILQSIAYEMGLSDFDTNFGIFGSFSALILLIGIQSTKSLFKDK